MSSAIEASSNLFELDEKEEAVSDFVSEIGRSLQTALTRYKSRSKSTQQSLALKLGINRSRVNRCFSGYANLTASSIAELAWAMGYKPVLTLEPIGVEASKFHKITHVGTVGLPIHEAILSNVATIHMAKIATNELGHSIYTTLDKADQKVLNAMRAPQANQSVNVWQIA